MGTSTSRQTLRGQGPGGIQIEVTETGLANIKADVIVNSCNQKLQLDRGRISRSLSTATGPRLQSECFRNYPDGVGFGEVAVTGGCKLKCRKVYHVALPPWNPDNLQATQMLCSSVCDCLRKAESDKMASVAFPPLGCGFLDYPQDLVALTMYECLRKFHSERTTLSLKRIVVCILPKGLDWRHIKEAFISVFIRNPARESIQIMTETETEDLLTTQMDIEVELLSTCDLESKNNLCKKQLNCGHICCGYKGEPVCLPCIQPNCAQGNQTQTAQDTCIVCYTENLEAAPVAMLTCKHMFHLHCLKRILQNRWTGSRINFSFALCPLCKVRMEHSDLESLLEPIRRLEQDLQEKAMLRLEYEKLTECEAIVGESSIYYQKPVEYAMDRYIYYKCFQCQAAFFAGTSSEGCVADESYINPEKLICPECRGQQTENSDAAVAKAVCEQRKETETNKVIEETTKKCPHCSVHTEKNGGCMHMTCFNCHMDWCWICEKEWCQECKDSHWFPEEEQEQMDLTMTEIQRILINDMLRDFGLMAWNDNTDFGNEEEDEEEDRNINAYLQRLAEF